MGVPEATLEVPEAILCKNKNKANSAQLGLPGAWAEFGKITFPGLLLVGFSRVRNSDNRANSAQVQMAINRIYSYLIGSSF